MEGRRKDGSVPGMAGGSRNRGCSPAAPLATPIALYGQITAHSPYMTKLPPPPPFSALRVRSARCPLSPLGRRRRRGVRGGRGWRVGKMAEASPQPGRFFCHCCSAEIAPRLPVSGGSGRVSGEGGECGQGRAGAPRGAGTWERGLRGPGGLSGGEAGGCPVGLRPWHRGSGALRGAGVRSEGTGLRR